MTDTAALRIEGVTKSFGSRQALAGIDLTVAAGEILGLLGPNGAGKTTLVRAIAGRVRPDAGTIRLAGVLLDPDERSERRKLGWVPQEIALYPELSVSENLTVFGRYQGLRGAELRSALERSLEWAGLSDRARDLTKSLSGGMKRRLNLAAGVIHGPELILMDEPTVGVDPQSRERIYSMIEELRGRGISVVYTTHYMEEAERLCNRIAVIDHGRIIAEGTREELVRRTVGDSRATVLQAGSEIPAALAASLIAKGAVVDGRQVRLPIADARRGVEEIFRAFDAERVTIDDLTMRAPTLETVFLHLTGRELRE